MNAILIWVLLPGAAAVALYALRRWPQAVYLAGVILAALLAWLAWQFPIGQSIPVRLWAGIPALRIQPDQMFFGSRFTLRAADQPALVLLYMSLAFWLGGSAAARTHRLFTPLGLAAAALFTAAMAASGVAAAMLLIALAALVCLPVLSPPGEPARRGAVRFLVYMLAGTCLVLFADASLSAALAGASEAQQSELGPTLLMLALGFALILAVVPFHTWLPMLGEEANPYAAAFVFYLLPLAVSFLALDVLGRYSISGLAPAIFTALRYAGVLMALTGGVGAAFERHLGRILGFGAITAMGMTVLAVSLNDQLGRATPVVGVYFAQMVPQSLALGVWGLALSILRTAAPGLSFREARGAGRTHPLAGAALLLANLSLAGMPLLAGFPPSLALWGALARTASAPTLLALLGCGGLALAALRSLAVLVFEEEDAPSPELVGSETRRLETAGNSGFQSVAPSRPAPDGEETRRLETAATNAQSRPTPAEEAVGRVANPPAPDGDETRRLETAATNAQSRPAPAEEAEGRVANPSAPDGEETRRLETAATNAQSRPAPAEEANTAGTDSAVAGIGDPGAASPPSPMAATGEAKAAATRTPSRLALKLAAGMRRMLGSARTVTAQQLEIATRRVQSRMAPGAAAAADGDGDEQPQPLTARMRWKLGETGPQAVLLGLGIAMLLITGCFPQVYMPTLLSMALIFAGGTP